MPSPIVTRAAQGTSSTRIVALWRSATTLIRSSAPSAGRTGRSNEAAIRWANGNPCPPAAAGSPSTTRPSSTNIVIVRFHGTPGRSPWQTRGDLLEISPPSRGVGQPESEATTTVRGAFHIDSATVSGHYFGHNGQPDPAAGYPALARSRGPPIKSVEDPLFFWRRDTRPVIGHGEHGVPTLLGHLEMDNRPLRAEFFRFVSKLTTTCSSRPGSASTGPAPGAGLATRSARRSVSQVERQRRWPPGPSRPVRAPA